jgi:hypothetical protein
MGGRWWRLASVRCACWWAEHPDEIRASIDGMFAHTCSISRSPDNASVQPPVAAGPHDGFPYEEGGRCR